MKSFSQLYKLAIESTVSDSRIDFPQEYLSNEVWDRKDGKYILKDDVKEVILDAVRKITKNTIFNIIKDIRIVGSICSNQYTSSSDIDVHFTIKTLPKDISIDELNKKLKEYIKEDKDLNELFIVTHPIEFYFQQNEYQDLMSAGVYDINIDEWIAGPSDVELDFNPYDEYKNAFPIIGEYVKRIEQNLDFLKDLLNKPVNKFLLEKEYFNVIKKQIQKILNIKIELRDYRRSFSSPESVKDAQIKREDKEWHKIDAVFKFIDKFGYLKKITLLEKLIIDKELTNDLLEEIKKII